MNPKIPEPTGDQCNQQHKVYEDETHIGYAMWYPSMGGYVGKCVVLLEKPDSENCVEVYVWHDGSFPFRGDDYGEERDPVVIHHCCPGQFIDFGESILNLQGVEILENPDI